MAFCSREKVAEYFAGKSVAIVGSGPGCLNNEHGFIDSHDVVVRVNNYRTSDGTGYRTDVFYSFHGSSIKKSVDELKEDGVRLVMCKCPDSKFMDSEWHRRMGKPHGVDFRYIYELRRNWWFCDTYVPSTEEFVASFDLLNQHIPSTGFSAILAALSFDPKSVYLTGFDFFRSRVHNVSEPWRPGNPDDPIGHAPERERDWIKDNASRMTFDTTLRRILAE
jgi:hypothetical protein